MLVQASTGLNRDANFYTWDVTNMVQDWVNGTQTNWGLVLISEGNPLQPRSRLLYGREVGGGLFPPRLTIEYTADSVAPQVRIQPLDRYSPETFTVRWCGADETGGSGIDHYDVQYRANNGSWTDWQMNTTNTSASFTGSNGVLYEFRARAVDQVNNVSGYTGDSEAGTTAGVPSATVDSFAKKITENPSFNVSWSVDANGATVSGYDVYYKYRAGPWTKFVSNTIVPLAVFTANAGDDGVYLFEAVALSSSGASETAAGVVESAIVVDRTPFTASAVSLPFVHHNPVVACTFSG